MSKVFIAGGTGTAGRAYAKAFVAAGHQVRASARPGTDAGFGAEAQPWPVDFDDAAATRAAVDGCEVVAIALAGRGPAAAAHEGAITRTVAEAAAAAGAVHLIYTSVHLADASTGVPHFDVKGSLELQLAGLTPRLTVLRPTTFADSLTSPWLRSSIERDGVLVSPIGPDTPISYVSTDDLARVAVAALQTPELQGPPVVVAGRSPCTYTELLPLLSELAGRELTYQPIPPEVVRSHFGPDLAAMTEFFNLDGFATEPSPVLHRMGLVPAPVQDYLRQTWPAHPAPAQAPSPSPSQEQ